MSVSDPIHVLFIHGLESGPNGTKTQLMRAQGLRVSAANMHMSVMKVARRNSAIRQIPRLDETRLVATACALGAGVGIATRRYWSLPMIAAGAAVWGASRKDVLFSRALEKSLESCVEIQRRMVAEVQPDVIVGSSWGGAVTAELLLRGYWRGPTVLLAPAVHKVANYIGASAHAKVQRLQALAEEAPIVVYHDPTDDTVPFEDSMVLTANSAIEFWPVDAGGHRLIPLLERGELKSRIDALIEPPKLEQ